MPPIKADDFYACRPDEQATRLSRVAETASDAWGFDPAPAMKLIKHRENAVFKVNVGDLNYALRVHRAGYPTDAELTSELQ